MAIKRACSYTATIDLPEAPSYYSAIVVTFGQGGTRDLITKNKSALVLDEAKKTVVVQLTQAETKQFAACEKAFMQIRCYHSTYDAPGSRIWAIDVCPSLNEEVLG